MFYLVYTNPQGNKTWELQSEVFGPAKAVMMDYGVEGTEIEAIERLLLEDPKEWHGHELSCAVGGIIEFEGNKGPMLQEKGDRPPQRRYHDPFQVRHRELRPSIMDER